MDWNAAIEKNREALKRVLVMLVAMARIDRDPHPGEPAEGAPRRTVPRYLYRAVLALLRPAEAAARRLVIVAARDLVMPPPPPRGTCPRACRRQDPGARSPSPASQGRIRGRGRPQRGILPRSRGVRRTGETGGSPRQGTAEGGGGGAAGPHPMRPPSLPLFDPLPRWNRRWRPPTIGVPRISFPGFTELSPIPRPPTPFDQIDTTRLVLRLSALGRALDDLPRQAARFARWRDSRQARRERLDSGVSRRVGRASALRPGRPPGLPPARRNGWAHEVHEVLDVVHGLARWVLEPAADTS